MQEIEPRGIAGIANKTANTTANMNNFFYKWKIYELEKDSERFLRVFYFAFTSLSTVGFGDYYPLSDTERFVCFFIFIFGTAIFSYI